MKRPVFTAALLLFHLFSSAQVTNSPLAAALPTPARQLKLFARVDSTGGYKNGTLDIRMEWRDRPAPGMKAAAEVRLAGAWQTKLPATSIRKICPLTDTLVTCTLPVTAVRLWSAELPVLYEVRLKVTDSTGHILDSLSGRVAFRDIAIRNGHLYVNGRQVWIKGMEPFPANDTRPLPSGAMQSFSPDNMLEEIRLMKQYNITAVQDIHADSERWHNLCDQYGLYLVDTSAPSRTFTACGPMPDNSLGGLRDYWDTARAHPDLYQGSFVYDIFSVDGKPIPAAWEVKKVYQPVLTTLAAGTKGASGTAVRVFNDYAFRDLSHLSMEWQVLVNGVAGQHGTAIMPAILPQRSVRIPIPVRMPATGEVLLQIAYRLKKAEPLLPAGHVVAWQQLMLREAFINDISVHPAGELIFKDEGGTFAISSPVTGLDLQFSKQTGWLRHYAIGARSLLDDTLGLIAHFWRPPTGCDYAGKLPSTLSAWKHAASGARLQLFSTSTSNDFVIVRADYLLPETACLLHVHYTINARGEMQVEEILEMDTTQAANTDTSTVVRRTMLPRMGMKWFLPAGFDSVIYYGRGPQENYSDRNDGAALGIYRQTVEEQFYPYRRPQENGTRTDIRWWKIADRQGHGLQIMADSALLSISALHYYDDDLDNGDTAQQGPANVPPSRPRTQVNIDLRQMSLGGKGLPYGNYRYIYKVTPF